MGNHRKAKRTKPVRTKRWTLSRCVGVFILAFVLPVPLILAAPLAGGYTEVSLGWEVMVAGYGIRSLFAATVTLAVWMITGDAGDS